MQVLLSIVMPVNFPCKFFCVPLSSIPVALATLVWQDLFQLERRALVFLICVCLGGGMCGCGRVLRHVSRVCLFHSMPNIGQRAIFVWVSNFYLVCYKSAPEYTKLVSHNLPGVLLLSPISLYEHCRCRWTWFYLDFCVISGLNSGHHVYTASA